LPALRKKYPDGGYVFTTERVTSFTSGGIELGYRVAGEAGRIEEALELVQRTDFDIAILDINLHSEPIFPVVEAIK
jgi:DNA-binding NarL/FixJ family response regulator